MLLGENDGSLVAIDKPMKRKVDVLGFQLVKPSEDQPLRDAWNVCWVFQSREQHKNFYAFGNDCRMNKEEEDLNLDNVCRLELDAGQMQLIMNDVRISLGDAERNEIGFCWYNKYFKEVEMKHFYSRDPSTNELWKTDFVVPLEHGNDVYQHAQIPAEGVNTLWSVGTGLLKKLEEQDMNRIKRRDNRPKGAKKKSGVVLEKEGKQGNYNSINVCIKYYSFITIFAYFTIN